MFTAASRSLLTTILVLLTVLGSVVSLEDPSPLLPKLRAAKHLRHNNGHRMTQKVPTIHLNSTFDPDILGSLKKRVKHPSKDHGRQLAELIPKNPLEYACAPLNSDETLAQRMGLPSSHTCDCWLEATAGDSKIKCYSGTFCEDGATRFEFPCECEDGGDDCVLDPFCDSVTYDGSCSGHIDYYSFRNETGLLTQYMTRFSCEDSFDCIDEGNFVTALKYDDQGQVSGCYYLSYDLSPSEFYQSKACFQCTIEGTKLTFDCPSANGLSLDYGNSLNPLSHYYDALLPPPTTLAPSVPTTTTEPPASDTTTLAPTTATELPASDTTTLAPTTATEPPATTLAPTTTPQSTTTNEPPANDTTSSEHEVHEEDTFRKAIIILPCVILGPFALLCFIVSCLGNFLDEEEKRKSREESSERSQSEGDSL